MANASKKISKKSQKSIFVTILSVIFLDVLGVGILIPVLPQLIKSIFIPAGLSPNVSLIMLGWLTAIYPLMQFVSTPILGQFSDRYGRKPILAFSLFGTAIGYLLFAVGVITANIPLLFIGRALDGITGGNLSVARATIADITPPHLRTRNFGMVGAMFGLGFVLGPYIGARLATPNISFFGLFNTPGWFDAATPFWFCAALSLANTLRIILKLPETNNHINRKLKLAWNQSITNIKKAVTHPSLRVIFGAQFFYWAGFTFFTTFFQIFLMERLGFKVNNVGDFFAYIGLWIAITQVTLTPYLAKRFNSAQILRFSLVGTGVALFMQLLAGNTTQLLLVSPFIAIFNGLTLANATTLVSRSAGKEIQGEVLGIEASVQALAQSIPAIISGYTATFGISVPVIVGGTVVVTGGLLFNLLYRPAPQLHEEVST